MEVATGAGPVVVVHAAIGTGPMRDHHQLQEMMHESVRTLGSLGAARAIVDVVDSSPSSRRFWHALRYLGVECSRAGGLLVVRLEHREAPESTERVRGPFYDQLDASESLDAGLRAAAEEQRLVVPQLDEL